MDFRHEWKHEISYMDMLTLRQRLRAVAQTDQHAAGGKYLVRSLYFDTPSDKALLEKLNGVSRREKFRIRYYNGDPSLIHLEKKSKLGELGNKQSAQLSAQEVSAILRGNLTWMMDSGRPLVQELYSKMRTQQLRSKAIVDYTRLRCADFLSQGITIPAGNAPIILEVKWDAFLPSAIRDAIQLEGCRVSSFSKYAQCRIYNCIHKEFSL